jgi:hypothetical protein
VGKKFPTHLLRGLMEEAEYTLTDVDVLEKILPNVLVETLLKFTFKSDKAPVYATLKQDIINIDSNVQTEVKGFIWVYNIETNTWEQIDLADIDTAIDVHSLSDEVVE